MALFTEGYAAPESPAGITCDSSTMIHFSALHSFLRNVSPSLSSNADGFLASLLAARTLAPSLEAAKLCLSPSSSTGSTTLPAGTPSSAKGGVAAGWQAGSEVDGVQRRTASPSLDLAVSELEHVPLVEAFMLFSSGVLWGEHSTAAGGRKPSCQFCFRQQLLQPQGFQDPPLSVGCARSDGSPCCPALKGNLVSWFDQR